jgi:hypothetical protein
MESWDNSDSESDWGDESSEEEDIDDVTNNTE